MGYGREAGGKIIYYVLVNRNCQIDPATCIIMGSVYARRPARWMAEQYCPRGLGCYGKISELDVFIMRDIWGVLQRLVLVVKVPISKLPRITYGKLFDTGTYKI